MSTASGPVWLNRLEKVISENGREGKKLRPEAARFGLLVSPNFRPDKLPDLVSHLGPRLVAGVHGF
jgi:hypothetical protein